MRSKVADMVGSAWILWHAVARMEGFENIEMLLHHIDRTYISSSSCEFE